MAVQFGPPTGQRPPILITPLSAGQAAQSVRDELQRAGWQVIVSSDVATNAASVGACIVILSPATMSDPAVVAAINANFPILIPVVTEPMSLPYARWAAAPILLSAGLQLAVYTIIQTLSYVQGMLTPAPVTQPLGSYPPPGTYPPLTPSPPSMPYPSQPIYQSPPSVQVQMKSPGSNIAVIVLVAVLLTAIVAGGGIFLLQGHQSAGPQGIAGTWDLVLTHTLTTSNGNAENDKLTIQQSGSQLTAIATNTQGGGLSLSGTLTGQAISLGGSITEQGLSCTIQFQGTLSDANDMGGNWSAQCTESSSGTAATDSGTWSAMRTTS